VGAAATSAAGQVIVRSYYCNHAAVEAKLPHLSLFIFKGNVPALSGVRPSLPVGSNKLRKDENYFRASRVVVATWAGYS